MAVYIHQLKDWTGFRGDEKQFLSQLGEVRNWQGKWMGKVELLDFELKDEAHLETLQDVLRSSEIYFSAMCTTFNCHPNQTPQILLYFSKLKNIQLVKL